MNASRPARTRFAVRMVVATGALLLAVTGGAAAGMAIPWGRSRACPGAETRMLIDQATAAVQADAQDTGALLTLGLAWYQHARETADPSDYARADEAFQRLLVLAPDNVEATIGEGTVALARHQFRAALPLAQAAVAAAPASSRAWGVLGDTLVRAGSLRRGGRGRPDHGRPAP